MITKDKNVAVVNFSPEQASFIVTKNQRLASAVYMVTNLMPETEPLKWKLRELSLGLLAEINLSFSSAVSPVVLPLRAQDHLATKMANEERRYGCSNHFLSTVMRVRLAEPCSLI